MTSHAPILIIIIPLISAFLIPIFGWWARRLCYPMVLFATSSALASSIVILHTVMNNGTIHYHLGGWEPPWGIEYVIDHLNGFMAIIVAFISFIMAIYSKRSIEQELPGKIVPFYTIFLLFETGLLGMVVTGDMFNLYVFLEITSLTAYALVAVGEDKAPLASFNYLVMGTIGACFYLLSVGYLYIATGSLNMANISEMLPNLYHSKVVLVAFAFFIVGISIKMALFPLHVWLPDAYTYAPSAVSPLIASLLTKVGAYVMIRVMFTVYKPYFSTEVIPLTTMLSWIAASAIIFGSVLALAQSDLKRMLAYSSVSQIGYIILGIGLANRLGFIGGLLHILNHAFMKGCLFLVAGAISYKTGTRNIYHFSLLNRKMPFTLGAFTLAALSMIGIPPTCGFFSKWYLILGSIEGHHWVFVAVILISSLLNAIYFFRVIEKAYFGPLYTQDMQAGSSLEEVPKSMLIPILIMAAGILVLGIFNQKIISMVLQFTIPQGF